MIELKCFRPGLRFEGYIVLDPVENYEDDPFAAARFDGTDMVIIWHCTPVSEGLQYIAAQTEWPPNVRGVVLYSGAGPRNARSADARVWVLSHAMPNPESATIRARFDEFRRLVSAASPSQRLPFPVLEPPAWPQSLVALYLIAIALQKAASADQRNRIQNGWNAMDGEWKRRVWLAAWNEYCERVTTKDAAEKWEEAGLARVSTPPAEEPAVTGDFSFVPVRVDLAVDLLFSLLSKGQSN